jgi:hypothetical protein
MIAPDRFPSGGYGKGRLHPYGANWHLAGESIPGSENLPGVGSVIRTNAEGNGATYVMLAPSSSTQANPELPNKTEPREVLGDLPVYPYRMP